MMKQPNTQPNLKCSTATMMLVAFGAFSSAVLAQQTSASERATRPYAIVDTLQTQCSDSKTESSSCPKSNQSGYGQDAQYQGNMPSYRVNNNGTVTDNHTQLIWAQTVDVNGDGEITASDKMTYEQGINYAANLQLAGYSDWRIPTIKELYSLILFDGQDPSGIDGAGSYSIRPFIDHRIFGFESGDTKAGERLIDSQYLSSTQYVSTTMKGDQTVFGVNFIDGRIKGYGMTAPSGKEKTFYVQVVRGNTDYGLNQLQDNHNGTVTDHATGMTWQQADSGLGMDWPSALAYCEALEIAGNSNWRLPNVKTLQSIVDYTRSPATSNSAAIDPLFKVTSILNEGEKLDYPNYWSSTTHGNLNNSRNAAYVSFGRSLGYMQGQWVDVHGAGAQRSDPKVDTGKSYPEGHGPQGDAVRYNNFVRCVSDSDTELKVLPSPVERDSKQYILTGNEASADSMKRPQMGQASRSGAAPKQGQKGRRPGGDPMVTLDSDKDGRISRDEVKGPLAQDFERFDRNNDGYLSQDEVPQRPRR